MTRLEIEKIIAKYDRTQTRSYHEIREAIKRPNGTYPEIVPCEHKMKYLFESHTSHTKFLEYLDTLYFNESTNIYSSKDNTIKILYIPYVEFSAVPEKKELQYVGSMVFKHFWEETYDTYMLI